MLIVFNYHNLLTTLSSFVISPNLRVLWMCNPQSTCALPGPCTSKSGVLSHLHLHNFAKNVFSQLLQCSFFRIASRDTAVVRLYKWHAILLLSRDSPSHTHQSVVCPVISAVLPFPHIPFILVIILPL